MKKLTILRKKQETKDAVTLFFKNLSFFKKIKYHSGQFITVKFTINGKEEQRAYSFSSSSFDKELSLTVKKTEKGIVSNYINNSLKEGDKVVLGDVGGGFYVEPEKSLKRTFCFYAAGSGITPLYSMTKTLLQEEPLSKVYLFYANKTWDSIIFREDLLSLKKQYPNNLEVVHILGNSQGASIPCIQGYMQHEILSDVFSKEEIQPKEALHYMCGPSGFMDKTKEILYEYNIERKDINLEAFSLPKSMMIKKSENASVNIIKKGATETLDMVSNKTILEQCLSKNVDIPFSCRSGMCNTCVAKCTDGTVKMLEGHVLPDDKVKENYVLTCISFPTSENVSLEFE
jgi:ring-1,2-phenylacetyl-CoA epoxidase subunit PaaE